MKTNRFTKRVRAQMLSVLAVIALSTAGALTFAGCNKNAGKGAAAAGKGEPGSEKTASGKQEGKKAAATGYKASMVLETGEDNLVSYSSLLAFMKPDYTPQAQDEEVAEKGGKKEKGAASKEKSESVVPGIRALTDYKTDYKTNRQKISITTKDSTLEEAENPKVPFTITDWGPQGKVVSESEFPSFYVVFSQPVRSLAALSDPTDKSDIMTITPPIKGVFRWYGTKHLAFEADEAADPATEYVITINKDTKSLGGMTLKGQTSFKTKAEQVSIKRLQGGYMEKGESAYSSTTGALPPYENRFYITLTYMVTPATFNELVSVKAGGQKLNYTIEPLFKPEMYVWGYPYYEVKADEPARKTDTYIVTITSNIPHNSSVIVSVKGGAKEFTYKTLQSFKVSNVSETTDYSEGQQLNPLRISFTQQPDKKTIIDNIKFDFDYKLTEENIEVYGNTLKIFNLPISFNEAHKITFGNGIKDIYGQSIQLLGRTTYDFSVRNAIAYVKFLDYGTKMLEAQFPHKMIFEYQNLEPESFYKISATDDPMDTSSEFIYEGFGYKIPEAVEPIVTTKKNTRLFKEVDFEPFLNGGYGFVKFDALTTKEYYDWWDDEMYIGQNTHTMTVQVTDLGITARIGLNKAVLMVRSLSTGKPVANADVYLFNYEEKASGLNNLLTSGKTDENGLCVITLTEAQIQAFESVSRANYRDYIKVLVQNGKDKAIFVPSSHNTWNFDIYTQNRYDVRVPQQRTFMFVDRGLYKPGETVTFRGIDRDQLLGTLKAHSGGYKIVVQEVSWDSTPLFDPITGTTSESGGFYGSFKLPDDVTPGYYNIKFTRDDAASQYQNFYCSFNVAEFERLKIEASVSPSDMTFYGGDKISAELSADYLAGGALNGADYEVTWYKQGNNFTTDDQETKDYNYGPYNQYSWRTYYSNDKGKLSSSGLAQLMCKSEKITDGLTYNYRVEANVTDVSNQTIMASSSVTVHPSLYYIGLKKSNTSGFAKKGQSIEFPYVLVNTQGQKLSPAEAKSKAKSINYVLKHDVWTMVHEQSIDSTIYARYEKSEVEDETGTIQIAEGGTLKLTPQNAGWYTLELTGKDKKGNDVITSIGFYVTGSGMGWHGSNTSEELTLTPDQSLYNPGETAQILLESPLQKGDYLITVEREGIFTEEIRHFDEPANVIDIPIASNYVPVIYVAVSSYSDRNGPPVHEYGETDLDKPKCYFGVCELNVNPYVRSFSVEIESDKQTYLPGEEASITLTATKGGKPLANAEITVMAVDRGVLDLINYHVPNPIDYFYSKSNYPLCVRGGDSRSLLMDPVTYSTKNLLGGDSDADEEKETERRDFRPTALFEPVLLTDKDGKAYVQFKMPDSLTTYRVTAFGVKDDLFALKEDEVKVQNLINIQQVQPRRLRERDTAECGVLITNLDKKGQKVTVSVEARSPTRDTAEDKLAGRKTIPGKAFVDGPTEHSVYVAPGDSTVVYFDIAAQQEGTVELVYTIDSSVIKDKLASPIKIEKTFVYETVTMTGSTGDDPKEKVTEGIIIPGFAKEGRGDFSLTLDATRLGVLGSSVRYLFEYPYGCFEQQSSRVLPLVLFGDYIDVFELDSKIADVNKCILYYTNYWGKSQLKNGGFPYWESSNYDSFYVSLRIAHICAAAIENGFDKSQLGIDLTGLTNYILSHLNYANDYNKAYACYVLKLLGNNQINTTLEGLYRRAESLTHTAAAFVSLAYSADSGLNSLAKAEAVNKNIRAYLQPSERSVSVVDANRDNDIWWWYESKSEQLAVILQAFVKVNPNDEMVDRLLFSLLQQQSMGYWTNTATTARVLDAIHTYIKMRNLDNTDFTAELNFGGKQLMKESFKGVAAKPKTLKLPFEDEFISSLEKDKATPVTFSKEGTGRLYYTIEMKYALPDEMQSARSEGLIIDYQISDYDTGDVISTSGKDDSLLTLESGKLYKATIRLESHRDRTYIALRAPIPSGAEILDSTFVTTSSAGEVTSSSETWGHWLSNKTIYDNEIQFFWDNFRVGSSTVTFTFRASRRGVYPTPPVQAECMYEPEVFGRSDGYLVEIK